jgi:hypothetical protein
MKSAIRSLALLCLVTAIQSMAEAQAPDLISSIEANDRNLILRLTAPIEVHFRNRVPNYGSAFYFQKFTPEVKAEGGVVKSSVQGLFLVTAKHVIKPDRIMDLKSVIFYMRVPGATGAKWLPIALSPQDVRKRLHVCPNPVIDVAVLDIWDLVEKEARKSMPQGTKPGGSYLSSFDFLGVSEEYFPGKSSQIDVNVGDDLVVIGYPRQFFDKYNKLPILKSGLLITPMGARYDNKDEFLIDFKEYEGMSGGLVISKPSQISSEGEHLWESVGRRFAFIGVYAGQRYKGKNAAGEENSMDLGIAWYYYNITDAINAPPMFAGK